MKIDGRLKSQRFKNLYGTNPIYVDKEKTGYSIGINGTSFHYSKQTKKQAESIINILIFAKP